MANSVALATLKVIAITLLAAVTMLFSFRMTGDPMFAIVATLVTCVLAIAGLLALRAIIQHPIAALILLGLILLMTAEVKSQEVRCVPNGKDAKTCRELDRRGQQTGRIECRTDPRTKSTTCTKVW